MGRGSRRPMENRMETKMQITKKRLKQIIAEELDRASDISIKNDKKINEIVSIIKTMSENELTELHENLKRSK